MNFDNNNNRTNPKMENKEPVKEAKQEIKQEEQKQPEMQIVHTPMGSTMKPSKFHLSQAVTIINHPEIDKSQVWYVINILGNDKYKLGSEGLTIELEAKDIKEA